MFGSRRVLGEDDAPGGDVLIEVPVLPGINDVMAAADDRGGESSRPQCAPMGGGVPAGGQPGDDNGPQASHLESQLLAHLQRVNGGPPGAHHGNGNLLVKPGHPPLDIEQQRRVENVPQAVRVLGVLHGDDPQAQPVAVPQDAVRSFQIFVLQRLCGRAGHSLHMEVFLPVAVIDLIRLPKMLQQRQLHLTAQPGEVCQPEPVF